MCGGIVIDLLFCIKRLGLSPRVRGNLQETLDVQIFKGSIPACAGESRRWHRASAGNRVYPRVCGGIWDGRWRKVFGGGLSPRVRGNLLGECYNFIANRSIPACAGESLTRNFERLKKEVYPRVCGGIDQYSLLWRFLSGLSPRVRGNPLYLFSPSSFLRSIPACAGESDLIPSPGVNSPVYPRVCGGIMVAGMTIFISGGLSPRVRGNLSRYLFSESCIGSIPACAGESYLTPRPASGAEVYPRVCGGITLDPARSSLHTGLSPRVRGNLFSYLRHLAFHRSIPACAGESAGR